MKTRLTVAACLMLVACAASTPKIDPARLNEVQKGSSTVDDVVRLFGRPSVLSKNTDGTQSAMYLHGDGPSGGTGFVTLVDIVPKDSVTFSFDSRGVLSNIKTTAANAGNAAPAAALVVTPGGRTEQPGSDKPVMSNASPSMQNTAAKPAQASANQNPQGHTSSWWLPGWGPNSDSRNR
jgi:outer membrane protein assembly factor BamE (lipoprotein component of BamABCDE complex)